MDENETRERGRSGASARDVIARTITRWEDGKTLDDWDLWDADSILAALKKAGYQIVKFYDHSKDGMRLCEDGILRPTDPTAG